MLTGLKDSLVSSSKDPISFAFSFFSSSDLLSSSEDGRVGDVPPTYAHETTSLLTLVGCGCDRTVVCTVISGATAKNRALSLLFVGRRSIVRGSGFALGSKDRHSTALAKGFGGLLCGGYI